MLKTEGVEFNEIYIFVSDKDVILLPTGIESRLDYIKDLGVGAVWLSPIYKSPMKDFGYDIQDFKDIAPVFGTMDDFHSLSKAMKERGKSGIVRGLGRLHLTVNIINFVAYFLLVFHTYQFLIQMSVCVSHLWL